MPARPKKKREKRAPPTDALGSFHPPTREWFRRSFESATKAQTLGWPSIVAGRSTLILAPTGSGKTLAAFLAAIDRLMWEPEPEKRARCRVLYVSPLKALAVDVERNLRAPIAGISAIAALEGAPILVPTVDVRTGDTPAAARARMLRHPPDVLITTPESLYLLLTSQARDILASIETVIIDEIHSLVPTKRGVHLFLSLERLEEIRRENKAPPLQRIGLSATQRPLDEVARFLGGRDRRSSRPVEIIDAGERKTFDLKVEVPVEDMSKLGEHEPVKSGPAAGSPARKSIWPSIHPRLLELIKSHRSTLIFVNSRRLAERLASAINELNSPPGAHADGTAPAEEIVLAHHGSVARDRRMDIEDRLKRGVLPAIIATSSLELGIDMGAIDLVVQIEAPPSIASAMQRIGRAGHSVGAISSGVVFPKFRGDLLACAAAVQKMTAGEVEETFYPRNALDVLAQQLVAICASASKPLAVESVFQLVRRAAPYAELPRSAFEGVLDMLSGRYPSDEFAELRPRITWDRVGGTIRAREGAARLAVVNGGTIADRGLYGVFLVGSGATGAKGETAKRVSRRV
ncbi:MAG: DEAD/DEAH box helicase, partial [Polyangiales bacterium]